MVIAQEIVIDAPIEVVWQTVTEPEHIAVWFADQVDLRAEPGYDGSVVFARRLETDAPPKSVRIQVQAVEPGRTFSYRWEHPQGSSPRPGNSLLVTFTLTPEGHRTRLQVVESELEDMGWTEQERDAYSAEHARGWATLLRRLHDRLVDEHAEHRS